MARCEQGYLCEVCGEEVEYIWQSALYLRYVIGWIEPELLHSSPERHILCEPALAQFIVDPEFPQVVVEGPFDKRHLDPQFVAAREELLTRGWRRLREVAGQDLPIIEYPLEEVRRAWELRQEGSP
ncbi:MAG: hypothetical protein KatS3mg110_1311 [Pirellulaceae bacterium]|nr:MAG: hypothetical protein KatS3mg110_1311 [Pirellulaceae bacterium]